MNPLRTLHAESLLSLPDPGNYFEGRESSVSNAPRNILLFQRRSGDALRAKARDSDQHHRYVLVYSVRGEGQVIIDDARIHLREREACLVLPFQLHFYSDVDEDFRWLFVTFEAADGAFSSLSHRAVEAGQDAAYLFDRLFVFWRESRPGLSPCLQMLLEEFLHRTRSGNSRSGERWHRSSPSLAARMNEVIYKDPGRAWSIHELAERVGYSSGHLRASFRAEANLSLGSYLKQLRLKRAAGLLVNSGHRISEVAAMCGYDSIYAFSRAFRRGMGLSPTSYRRSHQLKTRP